MLLNHLVFSYSRVRTMAVSRARIKLSGKSLCSLAAYMLCVLQARRPAFELRHTDIKGSIRGNSVDILIVSFCYRESGRAKR